jgi:hypothetical protein
MKWWDRIQQLQRHRWLPFFLPVIGTLLYIAIAVLLVPSEFDEKSDTTATDSDKTAIDTHRAKANGRAARVKRPAPPPVGAIPSAGVQTPAVP